MGQKFGSKFTTDIEAAYQLTPNIGIALGANNAFDAHPDRLAYSIPNPIFPTTGSTADGQIYPRSGGPFGINGGFWYAKVKIKY